MFLYPNLTLNGGAVTGLLVYLVRIIFVDLWINLDDTDDTDDTLKKS